MSRTIDDFISTHLKQTEKFHKTLLQNTFKDCANIVDEYKRIWVEYETKQKSSEPVFPKDPNPKDYFDRTSRLHEGLLVYLFREENPGFRTTDLGFPTRK